MERIAEISRKTGETEIRLRLTIDGTGMARIDCPVGFLTHMLSTFARHGLISKPQKSRNDSSYQ